MVKATRQKFKEFFATPPKDGNFHVFSCNISKNEASLML